MGEIELDFGEFGVWIFLTVFIFCLLGMPWLYAMNYHANSDYDSCVSSCNKISHSGDLYMQCKKECLAVLKDVNVGEIE